jgi:DNA (cytosine-5)-methyltransferase 1
MRIARPEARCVGYVEIGIQTAEILASRIEEGSLDAAPVWSDLRTFPGELYRGRVAGIAAGFPCPDYSVAGKRAGIKGKHGELWNDIASIARELGDRLEWMLLENVPGILVPHPAIGLGAGIGYVLRDVAGLGFDAEWLTIRASGVGASHGRNRWFCLAYRKGGRCGILRESSGRDRFIDGQHARMADTARHGEPGRERESRGERRRGICETGEHVADTSGARFSGREDAGTNSGDAGEDRRWSVESERNSGRVADPTDGFISEPGRGSKRRNGPGSASAHVLEDTGQPERGRSANAHDKSGKRTPDDDCRAGRKLGNANQPGLEGRSEPRSERAGKRAARPAVGELADATGESGSTECGNEARERRTPQPADRSVSGIARAELPDFAPGPGASELWRDLLVRNPELRPAISQAEIESVIHNLADGLAAVLDGSRTDSLRACGNGVVPLQAAVALEILTRRARKVTESEIK